MLQDSIAGMIGQILYNLCVSTDDTVIMCIICLY